MTESTANHPTMSDRDRARRQVARLNLNTEADERSWYLSG